MAEQTFIIKSLFVQNSIMLLALGAVILFFVFALVKKRPKHLIASLVWLGIVLWFFNSPFFGFSAVCVSPKGIRLEYGILSIRDTLLPIESPWKVEMRQSGLRKLKKLYLIRIADRESMKVGRRQGLALLKKIGDAIDRLKARELVD
ncbi:MAG: hypothetical protein JRJ09_17185 [Deltaproteobacteria bacterium]|nr:hypothetical protein [Deltaproteobacteria bacterium]MBW2050242.1 hypothetical protein [Deltaproteobacteria bacterium]MBW2110119.1 hypothetical protein [Deltaproteobacteria bacterium]MBW2352597.1 hypothetical protein [Deltaproteobacteria bacterium]HDZ91605.1 hypothetical protein [Deltaproteobacteria bacterium]